MGREGIGAQSLPKVAVTIGVFVASISDLVFQFLLELKLLIVHSIRRRVLDVRIVGFDGVRSSKHNHCKNIFFIGSFLGISDSVGLGRVAI